MLKKNVMRVFCLLLMIIMTASIAAGCGSTQKESSQAETTAKDTTTAGKTTAAAETAAEKTKIAVWTINRHDQEYMKDIVGKFNASNPDNIEVEYQIYADNYKQTLELALSTNELPDIIHTEPTLVPSMIAKNEIVFMNKYLTDEFKARFGEGVFIEGLNMKDGQVYSLPATGMARRLVYSKDIFKRVGIAAPPKSLDEMVDYAKLISSKLKGEGIYGFALPMKNPASGFARGFFETLQLSGYSIFEGYDFKTGKYDFKPYKPILEKYKEIFTSDAAFPACETLDIDPLRTQFADGKIGMYSTSNHSEWGVYTSQFPTDVDWAYAELPTIDGTIKGSQSILGSGHWWTITADSKNPDKAWKVVEYLYSDEVLAGYHERGLGIVTVPSALKIAKMPESIQKIPAIAFNEHDKLWPPLPTGVAAEGEDYYSTLAKIIFDQIKDMDGALEDLNNRYNAALDKAVSEGKTQRVQYPDFDPANPGKVFEN